ncbi:SUKH-4 family immunity protein [Kitasatospora sp. MMS16-BH015]|uniref:SUKH-4 family immunity protein n=1 Tax=Kitasatospora sp. MMS16-BH015 TaxID=2018025 RepID=UPI0020C471C3|nr:SUKH-4 family immunity protein [Kitasatospora sp. MMS16-BH015]
MPADEVIEAYRLHVRPVTGPGNTLVATYVEQAGGEERRVELAAGPGLVPVEHRLVAELARLGVPAEAVRTIHTALRPATLPGGYAAELLERRFSGAEITFDHSYGITAEERGDGVAALVEQVQREVRPAPPYPNRVTAPASGAVTPAESVRDVELGRRLTAAFESVVRYDADDLAASALPDASRATLTWAGQPAEVPLFFTADQLELPPVGGLFADLRTHLRGQADTIAPETMERLADFTRIGTDGFCVIAVRCAGEGAGSVWAVHPRTVSGRFVNGSLSTFLRSLVLLADARAALVGLDQVEAGAVVAGFQAALVETDPEVFRDDSTWWSVVIEQLWHGLF